MKVDYSCFARELEPRMRGQLLIRTLTALEKKNAGAFIFAGFLVTYFYDGHTLTIGTDRP